MDRLQKVKLIDFRVYKDSPTYHGKTALFKVDRVINSLWPVPGAWIDSTEVATCIDKGFLVETRPPVDKDF